MKGWIVIKSFYHKRQHLKNEKLMDGDINPMYYDQLEAQGNIQWVERPEIIMPSKNIKKKRNVRSRKRDV